MSHRSLRPTASCLVLLGAWLVSAPIAAAQDATPSGHVHDGSHGRATPAAGAEMGSPSTEALAGQAAFAAIAAVVETLEADPTTDWSQVDIEALRQHLIDMDQVMMDSRVAAEALPDGALFRVSGDGATRDAIRRMTLAHARALDAMPDLSATARETPGGAALEVRAADGSERTATRIRGLGFAGLLTLGSHHGPHHLMIARGQVPPGH